MTMAQEGKTIITDSSVIETKYYPGGKEIKEKIKNKNLVYYWFYRDNKDVLTTTAFNDTLGRDIGVSKQYDDNGKLLYTFDHDNGTWIVENKKKYPFYELLNGMKLKADSLIISVYGKSFLEKNTIWNINGSYIYNENESGSWTDNLRSKPNKFLFRYNVRLDQNHFYEDMIEFEINSDGKYIPNQYEQIYGFEKPIENVKREFNLNYNDAIEKAKKLGLTETDSIKAFAFLKWEGYGKPELYNGNFRFYVIIKTKTIKDIRPNGRSSVTEKFDVYSFNPWTGDFIEKKRMRSINSWEKYSGNSTGLIEDK